MPEPDNMVAGAKYRIRYQIKGVHRVPRECVALFLGMTKHEQDRLDRFELSGRPEYGSSDLTREQIISTEMVPSSTKCYHSRKVAQ